MAEVISIVGDGAMGTVCAIVLAQKGYGVTLWSYSQQQARELARLRENRRFLPGAKLPAAVVVTADDDKCFEGAALAISAVPCRHLRSIWGRLASRLPTNVPVVSVTKGIENDSLLRPTQIIAAATQVRGLAALSGPNIADELARRLPATATVASEEAGLARLAQKAFSTNWLRIYTNGDLIGVELAGAMKNVIAIAAGIIDGMRLGDNAKAALLTRGLVEIGRLGVAMGAQHETFAGLSGMGDLITTCISPKGRNRSFGQAIGQGKGMQEALGGIPGEVEGVNTCRSVMALAVRHGVEMPITQGVYQILFEGKPLVQAVGELMTRELKSEVAAG